MTDTRKIKCIVFTPTGTKRQSRSPDDWWMAGDGRMHYGTTSHSYDIYTREVIYEEQVPAEPETPDLRDVVNSNISDPGTQYAIGNIIDRLEAQKDNHELSHCKITSLQRRVADIEEWVQGGRRANL